MLKWLIIWMTRKHYYAQDSWNERRWKPKKIIWPAFNIKNAAVAKKPNQTMQCKESMMHWRLYLYKKNNCIYILYLGSLKAMEYFSLWNILFWISAVSKISYGHMKVCEVAGEVMSVILGFYIILLFFWHVRQTDLWQLRIWNAKYLILMPQAALAAVIWAWNVCICRRKTLVYNLDTWEQKRRGGIKPQKGY